MEEIKPGRYRHFKGGEYEVLGLATHSETEEPMVVYRYEVLGLATHSETEEPMVVYRPLYGERGLWVRPAAMWNETVERDGKTFRRFTYIGDEGRKE